MWSDWDGVKTFFLAAHTALCFGLVTKTTLLIDECFSHCWAVIAQSQGFLCLSLSALTNELGWSGQEGERGRGYNIWPELAKGIFFPNNVMLSCKNRARRRGIEFGGFQGGCCSEACWAVCPWEVGSNLLFFDFLKIISYLLCSPSSFHFISFLYLDP